MGIEQGWNYSFVFSIDERAGVMRNIIGNGENTGWIKNEIGVFYIFITIKYVYVGDDGAVLALFFAARCDEDEKEYDELSWHWSNIVISA